MSTGGIGGGFDTEANTVVTRGSTVLSYGPAWSPDGIRIAFVSAERGFPQIHTMKPDGSGRVQLTFQGSNSDPVWSPDGRRITFVSDRQGERQVFVMNADGSGQFRLTRSGEGRWPTWSPDGQRIVYAWKPPVKPGMLAVEREGADVWRLFSVNVDGTGEAQLTGGQ